MINEHISEEDIQLAVLDKEKILPGIRQHLDQCAACREKLKGYQSLFTGIAALPKSSFDFDVVDWVMPALPERKKATNKIPVIAMLVLLLAGLLSLPFLLFDHHINGIWEGISPWMLGLLGIAGAAFLVISLTDLYKSYYSRLQKLNFE